ncbi:uncharacterized protein E0L32_008724 [Thyridium curvatum]|uniref:Uncharacterized protein n=1 Tax=Thyridium curvatum TaxID=1093900 RepID=A0A507AZ73_9PEZI|nr:uncharacterized protein E0L32_008724 [Thyridium curvatum]TPX10319.1 hypothetical protein E0L32_008724 [Thyridium curvatum]
MAHWKTFPSPPHLQLSGLSQSVLSTGGHHAADEITHNGGSDSVTVDQLRLDPVGISASLTHSELALAFGAVGYCTPLRHQTSNLHPVQLTHPRTYASDGGHLAVAGKSESVRNFADSGIRHSNTTIVIGSVVGPNLESVLTWNTGNRDKRKVHLPHESQDGLSNHSQGLSIFHGLKPLQEASTMNSIKPITSKPAIRRGAEDAKADNDQTIRNLEKGAYHDWPNEAAFDGLKEERGPIEIPVTGIIPSWAAGSLYRTGPGQSKVEGTPNGTFRISHWFDGLAHSHRFEIVPVGAPPSPDSDTGRATSGPTRVLYSSRRQAEGLEAQIKRTGSSKMFSFGQRSDPCIGFLGKFMSTFRATVWGPRLQHDYGKENIAVVVLPNAPFKASVHHPRSEAEKNVEVHTENETSLPMPSGHRSGLPENLWITTDKAGMMQVDPATLEPIGFATQAVLHPSLKGPLSCAHAQRDPKTGDMFNYNLEMGGRNATYRVFRVSASTGQTEILATIERPGLKGAYIHSFFLSENYVTLCVPSTHIAMNGLKILWERNLLDAIEPFDASKKCKWFVVDRHHGRGVVAEFESEAGFFFHSVNTFEEPAEDGSAAVDILADVIEFDNFDVLRSLYYDAILDRDGAFGRFHQTEEKRRAFVPRLARYRLRVAPPASEPAKPTTAKSAAAAERILAIPGPHAGELPTINPAYALRRHRYVYSLATRGLATVADTIVKTDTLTGEAVLWNNETAHTPGEAIFVARPGAADADEDDGVLLSVVLDGAEGTSYLLCLDARTMEEMGRAEVGFAVGQGFHGAHHPRA